MMQILPIAGSSIHVRSSHRHKLQWTTCSTRAARVTRLWWWPAAYLKATVAPGNCKACPCSVGAGELASITFPVRVLAVHPSLTRSSDVSVRWAMLQG